MPRLNKKQQAFAKELALELYKLEALAEDHCTIIQQADPNQVAEAYARCAVGRPPVGALPPRDQEQAAIAQAERDLKVPATTLDERIVAVSTAMFLSRIKLILGAENNIDMLAEVATLRHAHHQKNLENHPPPQHLPPATVPAPAAHAEQDPESDNPDALPASALHSRDFRNAARLPLKRADINKYRRNPDSLLDASQIFVSKTSGDFYQVSSIVSTRGGKLFYLTYADEGSEGVSSSSEDFFSLLSDSCKVQV
ncbi:hypothetical protein R3P38DRAFT_2922136 [Favolaschia claudopus]|uniref:Uncharacterized protein n=1 Tax=Favolaschia claudopus TaxID=2862362 RepID=A0AAW0C1R9_9AGAR